VSNAAVQLQHLASVSSTFIVFIGVLWMPTAKISLFAEIETVRICTSGFVILLSQICGYHLYDHVGFELNRST